MSSGTGNNKDLKGTIMAWAIIIVALALFVGLGMFAVIAIDDMNRSDIQKWAEQNSMIVDSIEPRYVNIGPFWFKDKNQQVYRIVMSDGRVIWMRTSVFGNEYIESNAQ